MSNGRTPAGDAAFVAKLKDRLQRQPNLSIVLITVAQTHSGARGCHVVEYGTQLGDVQSASLGLVDHILNA